MFALADADADELTSFLLASRSAYNDFVLYHNFRHVSDVLQAIFFFLVSVGTLPPYPLGSEAPEREPSAIADLLKPIDGLTLLISAIGHDVGHPGVNNAFLVALNAPLAQLYNDRSVLESFHCAAYSQILRRHWPQAFSNTKMRKLMIDSILATDMGLHFKYMTDVGHLQEKLAHNERTTDGWNTKTLEEYRDLTCGLLIKCADISNVARKFHVAARWADILTDEFSNQGRMENRLNIPTCLFGGPPVRDDLIKLGQSQIGFMNVFARPLFEAVTDVLPAMQFAVDELAANRARWESEIGKEKERQLKVAASNPKAPGLLHLRNIRGFDGSVANPSPKTTPSQFMLPLPPTSTSAPNVAEKDTKSTSDPHPMASLEAQADAKRRLFNPGSLEFGSTDEPAAANNANHSSPGSRRGSADPSLTTILVTQQAPGTPTKEGTKVKQEKWDMGAKRGSVDSQTASQEHIQNQSSSAKDKQKSPTGSQAASEKGVVPAPEENAGSVAAVEDYLRSDSGALAGANGSLGTPATNGNGLSVPARGPGKKSRSLPTGERLEPVESGFESGDEGHKASDEGHKEKAKPNKFGLGKFWKKRWRAVSGVDQGREGMKSKERLAVGSRGADQSPVRGHEAQLKEGAGGP
ncbi:MAG: 3',5'-cyclic nucleotide phosphodiesterase [Terriglobus roseus]|nr:3',5'-cyclic nucleotide phosphodiesterase [Terriglobus roseus]